MNKKNKSKPSRKDYFLDDAVSGKAYDGKLVGRLMGYVRPYRGLLLASVFFLLLVTTFSAVAPLISKYAIDLAVTTGDLEMLQLIILIYLGITAGEMIGSFCETLLFQYLGQKVMQDMRIEVFTHVQRLSLTFFDRNPVGRLMTRLMNDVSSINEMFASGFITIVADIIKLVVITGIMLSVNWQLALLLLAVLPIMLVVTLEFRKRVRGSFRLVRQRLAVVNAYLQENITGMREVHLFNRQQRNADEFSTLNNKHLDQMLATVLNFAVYFPIMEVLSAVGIAVIIWWGGSQLLAGAMTYGTIFMFTKYAKMFWRPIMDLSEKYHIMQSSMASLERLFRLLDANAFIEKVGDRPEPDEVIGEIEFKNVWFAYEDENWVLRDVSFKIPSGHSLAVVGATGSGKSTLIKLVCRLYNHQKGTILIDGRDLRTYDPLWLRKQMATVLQDVFLFAGDVSFNIGLGDETISQERIETAARHVHAHHFIEKLPKGYETNLKERGAILSSGQKQLLSFARALAHDPAVLILDEATAHIDTEHEQLIQNALSEVQKGRTSIIIAHRLSTITHCDIILVMHKGQVREMGNHQELLAKRDLYYRLYQLQYAEEHIPVSAYQNSTQAQSKKQLETSQVSSSN